MTKTSVSPSINSVGSSLSTSQLASKINTIPVTQAGKQWLVPKGQKQAFIDTIRCLKYNSSNKQEVVKAIKELMMVTECYHRNLEEVAQAYAKGLSGIPSVMISELYSGDNLPQKFPTLKDLIQELKAKYGFYFKALTEGIEEADIAELPAEDTLEQAKEKLKKLVSCGATVNQRWFEIFTNQDHPKHQQVMDLLAKRGIYFMSRLFNYLYFYYHDKFVALSNKYCLNADFDLYEKEHSQPLNEDQQDKVFKAELAYFEGLNVIHPEAIHQCKYCLSNQYWSKLEAKTTAEKQQISQEFLGINQLKVAYDV